MNLYVSLFLVVLVILSILFVYAYHSGACKQLKKYPCSDSFCLYKEFSYALDDVLLEEVNTLLKQPDIQTYVHVQTFPERIFTCAMPNKKGKTISTQNIASRAPYLIHFYQNELCSYISKLLDLQLYPTDLQFPTSCAILIYDQEGDWINWHYDYNYYDGRFFTVLIPITNDSTCTEFQLMNDKGDTKSIQLTNHHSICFEGNYLYHRASKMCKNQKRVLLSCQFVTENHMSPLNTWRIKLKDFAYTGKLT